VVSPRATGRGLVNPVRGVGKAMFLVVATALHDTKKVEHTGGCNR
jgi:hypothetical protein